MNGQLAGLTDTPGRRVKVSLAAAAPFLLEKAELIWNFRPGHAVLAPSTRVERSTPYDLYGPAEEAERLEKLRSIFAEAAYSSSPLLAARMNNVGVDLTLGICVTADGRILAETALIAEGIFKDLESSRLLQEGLEGAEVLTHPVLHVFHRASGAYGHFVLDVLGTIVPFLPVIRAGMLDILVPIFVPAWALEALMALGVPRKALRPSSHAVVHCQQIVIVSAMETYGTFMPHPDLCAALSTAARRNSSAAWGRWIYLSRARQTSYSQRGLLNEEALEAMLVERGFEVLEPGNMRFLSQVKAFSEASVIVGAHGSTFGNLVFARPGTTVIDLMPADWVGYWGGNSAERWLLNMTTAMRLDYKMVLCRSAIIRVLPDEDQSGLQKFGMQSEPDLELLGRVIDVLPPRASIRPSPDPVPASRAEPDPGLDLLLSATLDPLFRLPDRLGTDSAWWGHVPFAAWLVRVARPRSLVELGCFRGVSYFTFCQAFVTERLDGQCHAVDTWQGDAHAGSYAEGVYDEFVRFNNARYEGVSNVHRCSFDDALSRFDDGSIDILHIDGLHTYEAVRHDFETWLPKLSSRGIMLFHDAHERQADFGVWQLWDEVSSRWPGFLFHHSHGLGVLCVGSEVAPELLGICALPPADAGRLRERMQHIGARWQVEMEAMTVADLRAEGARLGENVARLEEEVARLSEQEQKLIRIEQSSTWRATAPLRAILARAPAFASFCRLALRTIRWTMRPGKREERDAPEAGVSPRLPRKIDD